jgi:predicted RNA-binding protein Jag
MLQNHYKNSNAFIGALIGPGGKVIQELQQLEQLLLSMKIQLLKKALLKFWN